MRLVKQAFTGWGPKECTCTTCKDTYEVAETDITSWTVRDGDMRETWDVTVYGWECPTCGTKHKLNDVNRLVMDMIKRRRLRNELQERTAR